MRSPETTLYFIGDTRVVHTLGQNMSKNALAPNVGDTAFVAQKSAVTQRSCPNPSSVTRQAAAKCYRYNETKAWPRGKAWWCGVCV